MKYADKYSDGNSTFLWLSVHKDRFENGHQKLFGLLLQHLLLVHLVFFCFYMFWGVWYSEQLCNKVICICSASVTRSKMNFVFCKLQLIFSACGNKKRKILTTENLLLEDLHRDTGETKLVAPLIFYNSLVCIPLSWLL